MYCSDASLMHIVYAERSSSNLVPLMKYKGIFDIYTFSCGCAVQISTDRIFVMHILSLVDIKGAMVLRG